ncbi:MAG TPA: DUF1552 domain-containing protein, partial [Polyangiaceae bacterium]|nr:DUF1552 domain-containing protein [Polyangiaceae bacterium]
MKTNIARRKMLKGLGVSLALPWLETFAPKTAKAQAAAAPKRYMSVYFPNGTSDQWWFPSSTGAGASWQMSPILEPLTPLKQYVTAIKGIGNYSPFGGHIEPSHGHNSASIWTGVKANGPNNDNNGISVDQVIGNQLVAANGGTLPTPLHSLQLGVSTIDGSPDGIPPQHSHSASWKSPSEPLYKIVSPQAAFDRIVGGGLPMPTMGGNMGATPDPAAEMRRALKKSALDYIMEQATGLQTLLSTTDQAKVQQFLDSVRTLEMRVADPSMPGTSLMCSAVTRPQDNYGVGMETTPDGSPYNRGNHVTLMTDLLVMAVQCDITR